MGTQFDDTTTVVRVPGDAGQAEFAAELDPAWGSLLGLHGGYVAAVAVRAVQEAFPDREVRTVTTSFLRPAQAGSARVTVSAIRSGRSFTTAVARVSQGGRDALSVRATLLVPVAAAAWATPVPEQPPSLDACVPFTRFSIGHFSRADFRIDPATVPASDGSEARVAGYIRPLEDREIDAPWLIMAGDFFPPSAFRRVAPPAGGVSIDYTIHLHQAAPDPGQWLAGVFSCLNNTGGIALEHGTLATPGGAIVAETFQTRWTG